MLGKEKELIEEQNGGWFPKATAIDWLSQMAEITAYIHSKKIFHRDMHFANWMIVGQTVYLLDFGDSLYLENGVVDTSNERYWFFHPWITAPEMQQGKPTTFSADIFTIAVQLIKFRDHRDEKYYPSGKILKALNKKTGDVWSFGTAT